MDDLKETAVANSLACLMTLARHSLLPTQTKIASKAAGELLWFLGIPTYTFEGMVFTASAPPERKTF
jgi:hypothetical protein